MLTQTYYTRREIIDFKDLISQSTAIYGNKNAFLIDGVMGEKTGITYKELIKDIEAVGTEFINMGLWHEQVAIIGDNSYEWCLTYLGTTCGVGTIVPVDKNLPIDEIKEILLKSHAKAVVFSENTRDRIVALKNVLPELKYYISMDSMQEDDIVIPFKTIIKKGNDLLKIGDQKFSSARIDPSEANIIQYKYNDFDELKGVLISQENICANIRYMTSVIDIRESDLALSVMPLSMMQENISDFLMMLYCGATITFSSGNIIKNIKEAKPSVIIADTEFYETLYKNIWITALKNRKYKKLKRQIRFSNFWGIKDIEIRRKKFSKLLADYGGRIRLLISVDSKVNSKVLKGLQNLGFFVIQGYGTEETSNIAFINHVKRYKNNSIGMPIPGIEVSVNEPNDEGVGEVLIKGKTITEGYYNDEESKETLFNKDGYLKTGILAKKDKEGFFYLVGKKRNIIINHNDNEIFPEEIENKVTSSDFIKQCLVYCKKMGPKEELKVCTIIVPDFEAIEDFKGKSKFDVEGIRKIIAKEIKKCNKKLPSYKHIKDFELRNEEFDSNTIKNIRRVI